MAGQLTATRLTALLVLFSGALRGETPATSEAIRRGIAFIQSVAENPKYFAENGDDLLFCFYELSVTSADPRIRKTAATTGRILAAKWVGFHRTTPDHPTPNDLVSLAAGAFAAGRFGASVSDLRASIRRAAKAFSSKEFFLFDPTLGPPPRDLSVSSRYDMWCDALITSFDGEVLGVPLGARFRDVIRWLRGMRPYPTPASDLEFYSIFYSVTHVVYTVSSYNRYRVNPACLQPEYEFLKANLPKAIALNDPEATGEFLDTLRSFGLTDHDPLIRQGVDFVLSKQNADGSWGDPKDSDIYNRYHSTWTAVDGLRRYRFRKARSCANPLALTEGR